MKFTHLLTKKGDSGYTGLFTGDKTHKTSPRIAMVGRLDSLNARLGYLYSITDHEKLRSFIDYLQDKLVYIMGEVASDGKYENETSCNDLAYLDKYALELAEDLDRRGIRLNGWVKYGRGKPDLAYLDVVTTDIRECELALWVFEGILSKNIMAYFNRLSKIFFLLHCEMAIIK